MSSNHEMIDCTCGVDCKGIKAYVKIYYGPYVSWGILRHRTHRLKHLVDVLQKMGHTVELIPTKLWDRVEINICGRIIHRMKLTDLKINPRSIEDDTFGHQAINAVVQALTRITNADLRKDLTYESIL